MKFVFLGVPSAKEEWSELAKALYTKKIQAFLAFEFKNLAPPRKGRNLAEVKRQEESKLLSEELAPEDYVILFDEGGKPLSSLAWAKEVERILQSGKKRAVWILGGAYGVNEELKGRAQLKISLGPQVMNHLVAQTVAMEQLYRAFTIIKKLPYHNS